MLRTGDAAEKADIVATNDQNVFPGFQHSGSNPMRPGELPVILRIRLSGDLSSRPAVKPRPRFIVDRAELQFALHTGPPLRQLKFKPVPEQPAETGQVGKLRAEITGDPPGRRAIRCRAGTPAS